MKAFEVLFLGTCACDFSPKLKTEFKDNFDFDARRSSSVLVNGKFLIDCGIHCMDSLRIADVDISLITDIFVTHLHSDHYNPEHINLIAQGKRQPLRVWVRKDAILPEIPNTEVIHMDKHSEYEVSDGLKVISLPANHDETVFPHHFMFKRQGKSFLYACDGAWFLHETYYALRGANLSLAVLDCTCGDYEGDYRMGEHNSIPMIRLMMPSLKVWGTIGDDSAVYISHIAPSLHRCHKETEDILKEIGVKVAYDGLKLSV